MPLPGLLNIQSTHTTPRRAHLGVGVDELGVHLGVLDLLAHHQQVLDQVVILARLAGGRGSEGGWVGGVEAREI